MTAELRQALVLFVLVSVAIAVMVQIDVEVPLLGHLGSALVAITLLYSPLAVAWARGQDEDLTTYGFVAEPLGRGIALGLGVPLLVIFPLFVIGYLGFYTVACGTDLALIAPLGACERFDGLAGIRALALDMELAQFALVQLIVVALPEELFFRGCLLYLLEKALPPRRRILGGGIGWALLLSAAMFALVHIPRDGDLRSLATFFPGLLFGWMRSATGSILAPTLAHTSSNVLIRVLNQMVLQ